MHQKFASRARQLRSRQTDAELRMWARLRDRRLHGFKFVRQEQIGPFFADFACREANLIIEIDGSQHLNSAYDASRTKIIETHGYRVVRFWNADVLLHTDAIVQLIADQLAHAGETNRFDGREAKP